MTRNEMAKTIKGGGSVLLKGRIITSVDDLPEEEDLAETDEQKAAAADALRSETSALSERLAKIEGAPAPSSAEATQPLVAALQEASREKERSQAELGDVTRERDDLRKEMEALKAQVKTLSKAAKPEPAKEEARGAEGGTSSGATKP
jgi:chromosome segregation ATPase